MADGHFYKRGTIKLHLANRDVLQVVKYGQFINYTGRAKPNVISIMNPSVVWAVSSKFRISNRKTSEPCDLSQITNLDLLFSLFVGFFDGDGTIYRRKGRTRSAAIKTHGAWLGNLSLFEKFLYCYFDKYRKYHTNLARLNGRGYALLLLSDLSLLAAMKRKALELRLPLMERKWDLIDENIKFSSHEKSKRRFNEVIEMLNVGKTNKEIANILGVTENAVYMYLRRKNLCHKPGSVQTGILEKIVLN